MRLFAALIIGTLRFWIRSDACDIADAFSLKEMPASLSLLAVHASN